MKRIQTLLKKKGYDVWSIAPDASVYDAIHLMAEKAVGALIVMDGPKLVGVISERDYARKIILEGRSSENTKISEIMSSEVITTGPDNRIEECMAIMTERRIRHLPVLDGNEVLGVISLGDLVKYIIAEQQFVIEQMERYING
ncbi:MAG: CBS domain-containing protein [Gammaproteobacteria bacterium]